MKAWGAQAADSKGAVGQLQGLLDDCSSGGCGRKMRESMGTRQGDMSRDRLPTITGSTAVTISHATIHTHPSALSPSPAGQCT